MMIVIMTMRKMICKPIWCRPIGLCGVGLVARSASYRNRGLHPTQQEISVFWKDKRTEEMYRQLLLSTSLFSPRMTMRLSKVEVANTSYLQELPPRYTLIKLE